MAACAKVVAKAAITKKATIGDGAEWFGCLVGVKSTWKAFAVFG